MTAWQLVTSSPGILICGIYVGYKWKHFNEYLLFKNLIIKYLTLILFCLQYSTQLMRLQQIEL